MLRAAVPALLLFVACNSPQKAHEPRPAASSNAALAAAPSESADSQAACTARCNGEFAPHGMLGKPSCLCRTRDVGRDCRGADCEGQCVLDPVRSEVSEPGPPARGYFIGRCSEFVKFFGCARLLTTKPAAPVDLSQVPPQICID